MPDHPNVAASRGAELFDSVSSVWFRRMNLETLDVSHSSRCPGGQLYGRYQIAMRQLFPQPNQLVGARNGLNPYPDHPDFTAVEQYRLLNAAWRSEIRKRLAKADKNAA